MKNLLFLLAVSILTNYACSNSVNTDAEIKTEAAAINNEAMEENTFAEETQEIHTDPETAQKVEISTDFGKMILILYDETPKHKENFMKLVSEGFYDGLLFHRVISDFMIQGGDPDSRDAAPGKPLGNGGVGYKISAEIHPELIHKRGALAAARDNNPQMASSGCQFYIVWGQIITQANIDQAEKSGRLAKTTKKQRDIYATLGGTPHLDGTYTVFGEVIEGLEVVDKIRMVPTNGVGLPKSPVRMNIKLLD